MNEEGFWKVFTVLERGGGPTILLLCVFLVVSSRVALYLFKKREEERARHEETLVTQNRTLAEQLKFVEALLDTERRSDVEGNVRRVPRRAVVVGGYDTNGDGNGDGPGRGVARNREGKT